VFDKFKRASKEPADLDIIPVMNLFMVLIPFLLLGAAFVHIGVIPTSTPTKQESSNEKKQEQKQEEPKSVTANLVLTSSGMRVSFSGSNLSDEKVEGLGDTWTIEGDDYPVDKLQETLRTAKEKYPESSTVTVLPHDDFKYENLVYILDHTREKKVGEKPDGSPRFEPLFPVTVFSKFIPSDNGNGESSAREGGGG